MIESRLVSPYISVGIPKEKMPGIQNKTPEGVIELVCEYFVISRRAFFEKRRHSRQIQARFMAAYIIRTYLHKTYVEMTQYFGENMTDHTSVIYAVNVTKNQLSLKHNNETKEDVENILALAYKK